MLDMVGKTMEKSSKADLVKKPSSPSRGPAAAHFRGEIEKAEAEGVSREEMTLRLTLNDVNQLRRDGSLPVADISYAHGTMRYLGVKVTQGGVPESVLSRED
jgi:hypothetical protein